MIDKSEPGQNHWNMTQIQESELKPIVLDELIEDSEVTLGLLSSKLILPASYFPPVDPQEKTGGEYLPKLLKQRADEPDASHAKRVKDHMTIITDQQFANLSHLVDPDDPAQMRFLNLYTELQAVRAAMKAHQSKQ